MGLRDASLSCEIDEAHAPEGTVEGNRVWAEHRREGASDANRRRLRQSQHGVGWADEARNGYESRRIVGNLVVVTDCGRAEAHRCEDGMVVVAPNRVLPGDHRETDFDVDYDEEEMIRFDQHICREIRSWVSATVR